MRVWKSSVWLATALVVGAGMRESDFQFPQIAGNGLVAVLPGASEPPRGGARIVFDVTAEGKPEEPDRGWESAARCLNLNAAAGRQPSDVKLTVVPHGGAVWASLKDWSYARGRGPAKNPNLPLIHARKKSGVEVFACGKSLARNSLTPAEDADDVVSAASAMTVNANRRQDGYSYLAVP